MITRTMACGIARPIKVNIAQNTKLEPNAQRELEEVYLEGLLRAVIVTLLSARMVERISVRSPLRRLPEVLIRAIASTLYLEEAIPMRKGLASSKRVSLVQNIAEVENVQQNGGALITGA
jgi:hypothetical protein